jgi:hypothetical protein
MAADKELNIGIKVTANTSGAKQAEKAIDGVTDAIQEQTVAEKELVAQENKSIEVMGRYVDAKGRIHEANGKFAKVAAEEREGIKEQIKLQESSTVTVNGAAQAKEKLAKSSSNGAMGLLALSNAVQDVQYGFGGMVNNIPQIITGLGMGMGVAGAVQIAAVGIQFLLKNVDLFGEKAKQAARDAADLTADLMSDADAAYKNAEATKAATEAQDRHNDAMQAADERYKEQIRLSDELIKQKQAEADAEIALADAQAGFEMAQIQLAEGRGEISKEEAIIARNKVRTEADARKQTAAIAMEEAKVAEARKKAASEEVQAQEKRGMALQLMGEGRGMLTKGERELAGKNKGSAQAQLEQSRIRQEEIAKTIAADERIVKSTAADIVGVFDKEKLQKLLYENRAKLAKETEEAAKLQADINREDQKLKKDREARLKTGIKDGDRTDLDKAVQSQFGEAKAAEQRAAGLMGEAATGESGIAQSQRLFGMRQATGAMQAQAQIEAERRAKQEEERRAQEKAAAANSGYGLDFMGPVPDRQFASDQKARARELKQVGTAGGALASTLAGDGLAPGFTDKLREAAGGAGDAAGLDRLMKMVAMLTANTKKLSEAAKSKLDKLEAEIEDLKTAK